MSVDEEEKYISIDETSTPVKPLTNHKLHVRTSPPPPPTKKTKKKKEEIKIRNKKISK